MQPWVVRPRRPAIMRNDSGKIRVMPVPVALGRGEAGLGLVGQF
jgi:hypothetical protein